MNSAIPKLAEVDITNTNIQYHPARPHILPQGHMAYDGIK